MADDQPSAEVRNAQVVAAVLEGDVAAVEKLVHNGLPPLDRLKSAQQAPLAAAVFEGNTACIKAIVKVATPDYINATFDQPMPQFTALHAACIGCKPHAIRLLLEAGADATLTAAEGEVGIHCGFFCVMNRDAGQNLECLQIINQTPCDITKPNLGGATALHYSCMHGLLDCVDLLLAEGADPNARDQNGWSAMHFAAAKGHEVAVKMLLEAGADINAVDKDNRTPLACAVLFGFLDVVAFLIHGNVNPLIADIHGQTPLHIAAEKGNVCCVQMLLDSGADPTAKTQDGRSCVDMATDEAVVAMLSQASEETESCPLTFLLRKLSLSQYQRLLLDAEIDNIEMLAVCTADELEQDAGIPAEHGETMIKVAAALQSAAECSSSRKAKAAENTSAPSTKD
eukprot:m.72368 g.72368  ORF g.72368 m.72368 type:complete len:398 (+) comp14245_c1_seq4:259-1452(+)